MTQDFLPKSQPQTSAIETVPGYQENINPSNLETVLRVQSVGAEMTLLALGGSTVVSAVTGGVLYGMKKWREHRSAQATHKPDGPKHG